MMSPEVSVLMPAYNVAPYLSKSIESVLNQSFTDFELIIVNDGSTDDTGSICDQYAQNDKRITVIHKDNGGFFSARNAALPLARGRYVFFMDSDDWIEKNLLKDNIALAEQYQSDIVFFGHFRDKVSNRGMQSLAITLPEKKVFNNIREEGFFETLQKIEGMALWQMLIKREIITQSGLYFTAMHRESDIRFITGLYSYVNGPLVFNNIPYYHYLILRLPSKVHEAVFSNHKIVFSEAVQGLSKYPYAKGYLQYLYFTWLGNSVPNNFVADTQSSFRDKLKKLNHLLNDPDVIGWGNMFPAREVKGFYYKVIFYTLRIRSGLLLYAVIWCKRLVFKYFYKIFKMGI